MFPVPVAARDGRSRALRYRAVYEQVPSEVAAAARRSLGAEALGEGLYTFQVAGSLQAAGSGNLEISGREDGTEASFSVERVPPIPYFWWFMGPVVRAGVRRALRHASETVRADLDGLPPPAEVRRRSLAPPVGFSEAQITFVATVCAVAAVLNLAGALLGQNVGFISRTFDASDRELGYALAVTRAGILVSLVAAGMADRRGRRMLLIACVLGASASSAVSAVAPNLELFTLAQTAARGFVNAGLTIAAIAVVEEAPEGARAYSVAMITLASGAGFAAAVALLPLADLEGWGWRLSFAVSAATALLMPGFARRLRETDRYAALHARRARRGRISQVVGPSFGRRFWILVGAAFLINVFNGPVTQLTNEFLTAERDFSGVDITFFRTFTTLLPGLIGIVIGGRLAETSGRRPMAAGILLVATLAAMYFFTSDGWALWLSFGLAGFLGSAAAPALAAFGPELFPTEVRGTANAVILVAAVVGSVVGLVAVGELSGALGGLGLTIAFLGIAQLVAAALFVPRLPEPAGRRLDDLSPSEA